MYIYIYIYIHTYNYRDLCMCRHGAGEGRGDEQPVLADELLEVGAADAAEEEADEEGQQHLRGI